MFLSSLFALIESIASFTGTYGAEGNGFASSIE